ncbi:hypothetical protein, partial [Blautia marasmi]|uniref:hypothetical protein n=1 Tax=Blautia marasmi TaxID=1917868 RepID=UPI00351839B4
SSEELFDFNNKKMPYLCGFRRFANAYIFLRLGGYNYEEIVYDRKCASGPCMALAVAGGIPGK